MITKYKVDFIIDDEVFKIEVKDPSFQEKKELENLTAKSKEKLANFNIINAKKQTILNKIEYKKELIEINKELLKSSENKSEILKENRKFLQDIDALREELTSLKDIDLNAINDELEEALSFKNNLLIFGDDKERLLKTLKNKGICNQKFWEVLSKEIQKEQEKSKKAL